MTYQDRLYEKLQEELQLFKAYICTLSPTIIWSRAEEIYVKTEIVAQFLNEEFEVKENLASLLCETENVLALLYDFICDCNYIDNTFSDIFQQKLLMEYLQEEQFEIAKRYL